ncbi:MAG: type II secretion system protein GspH [Deltaproteobacteria bacterium]|nr:MAG: type II secretion system protein GspH [Deltaproteobacteria bacterium]
MKNSKGFTLIEVIVVLAVIGIMVTIAGISLVSSSRNAELRSSAQEMYGQFQRAKMEAIKRNQSVTILFVPPDKYRIFVDLDDDQVLDGGEPIIADVTVKNGIVFSAITFASNYTGFTSRGRPLDSNFGGVNIDNTVTSQSFQLTTSIAGYVRLVKL